MSDNKAIARRLMEEAWNAGKLEVLDEIIADNCVQHDPQNPFPELSTLESTKKGIAMYREAFSDLSFTVGDVIAEGDKVALRWTATGKNTGPMMGMPATGKTSTVTGISLSRFANGKVVETWANWDTLGMLQQLGVVPKMGG